MSRTEQDALLFNADEFQADETTQTPDDDAVPSSNNNTSIFQVFSDLVQRGLSGGGKLGWATAIPIMVSMSYGSSILILPYTLRQMGIVLWIIFIVFCFMVLTYSTILLKESSVHILRKYQDQVTDSVFIRHPYPKIAEMTVGRRLSRSLCM